MISLTIAQSIFKDTNDAAKIAGIYALDAHAEIALDWVGRQNFRIGQYLLYMRVVSTPADSCLAFNSYVAEYRIENSDSIAVAYMDDDWIDRDCISDLKNMLEFDAYSESWLISRMQEYIMSFPLEQDAVYLKDIGEF